MREVGNIKGEKVSVEWVDEALALVRKHYPGATAQGSVGAWSFHHDSRLVAEMWLKPYASGWWLKIAKPL